jgi:hypothetical protein
MFGVASLLTLNGRLYSLLTKNNFRKNWHSWRAKRMLRQIIFSIFNIKFNHFVLFQIALIVPNLGVQII